MQETILGSCRSYPNQSGGRPESRSPNFEPLPWLKIFGALTPSLNGNRRPQGPLRGHDSDPSKGAKGPYHILASVYHTIIYYTRILYDFLYYIIPYHTICYILCKFFLNLLDSPRIGFNSALKSCAAAEVWRRSLRAGVPWVDLGVSKNEGPQDRPQIVGLLLEDTGKKDSEFMETAT